MCLTSWTRKKAVRFLERLAETGNVSLAAQFAGLSKQTAYNHRHSDDEFARQWDDALDTATDLLEQEARRRAYEGVDEPVFYKGDEVGTIRKYSDTLLIFLLKGLRPEKYRDNATVVHEGNPQKPIAYVEAPPRGGDPEP